MALFPAATWPGSPAEALEMHQCRGESLKIEPVPDRNPLRRSGQVAGRMYLTWSAAGGTPSGRSTGTTAGGLCIFVQFLVQNITG